ncbi:hypothetical protein [Weissella paramesenteroides]|uniref:hypothetical protein n=1 Tax=Weissella paramesenteroides TaxID=1249 RepID=UPI0013DA6647|nr:hypothetical protein [Weissella paramesenteroides]
MVDEEPKYELHAHVLNEDRYWGAFPLKQVIYQQEYLASVYGMKPSDFMIVRVGQWQS